MRGVKGCNTEKSRPRVVITQSRIFAKLLSLHSKKSTSPDKIPNAFLKKYAESLSHYLKIIFDASLQTCALPQEWLYSRFVPVFRVDNYWPISSTSVCCKVMEHIISEYIFTFLEDRGIGRTAPAKWIQKPETRATVNLRKSIADAPFEQFVPFCNPLLRTKI